MYVLSVRNIAEQFRSTFILEAPTEFLQVIGFSKYCHLPHLYQIGLVHFVLIDM